jgi:hypothetical protein
MVRIFDIEFELVMCPAIEEPCEEIFCVARPSCCGFSCRFWKPPREGRCCRFLIDTIMFIFFRSLAPSHRPPPSASRCLPLLQARDIVYKAHVICTAIEPLEQNTSVARPSCCGFRCRFWKPQLKGKVLLKFIFCTIMIIYFRFPVSSSARGP